MLCFSIDGVWWANHRGKYFSIKEWCWQLASPYHLCPMSLLTAEASPTLKGMEGGGAWLYQESKVFTVALWSKNGIGGQETMHTESISCGFESRKKNDNLR